MPRLSNALRLRAHNISPLLAPILRETRDLPSALNELRWLREHVNETWKPTSDVRKKSKRILQLCQWRAWGVPLQYLLGTQPFGTLEIKCRSGVLIPRPETEAYTTHLANIVKAKYLSAELSESTDPAPNKAFRIVDFCSGTGCISLLLHSLLSKHHRNLEIIGLDVSPQALQLSRENLLFNQKQGLLKTSAPSQVRFEYADILRQDENILEITKQTCDIIISNPPYISHDAFNKETTRSVRNWEPRLALVPEVSGVELYHLNDSNAEQAVIHPEDTFYHRLLHFYELLRSKILIMEVGDAAQAVRVVEMAMRRPGGIEIWRDWPEGHNDGDDELDYVYINGRRVDVKGTGKMRAVVLYTAHMHRRKD
ncbi:hypothetical protein ACMFMG_004850 [Clarireedia jacksonii]